MEAQYNALTSNLMMWLLAEGEHQLQLILCGHVQQASTRRWGTNDLTWMVSKCGTMKIEGSPPWQNVCRGWATLKNDLCHDAQQTWRNGGTSPLEAPPQPCDQKIVKCSTIAQRALRNQGFECMMDVWDAAQGFFTWQEAR